MNKKTLRGVPKKAAEIPKSEERIQTEAIIRFADELMDEIQREYEKSCERAYKNSNGRDTAMFDFFSRRCDALEWVMRMICRKASEK